MNRDESCGYAYILIGATLWGVSGAVAKSLFNIGISPAELVLIRLTLSTLTLALIFLITDRKRMVVALRDLPYFLILGFVGLAGVQYTYYFAISKIHVGPAVLIQYLAPMWVALYAFIFQKEPVTRGKVIALLLALLGCYFTVGGYRMDLLRLNRIGIVSGLISSFFFSFYALYGEKGLKKYDPWTLILYGFGFGAAFYWMLISPLKILRQDYSLKIWMAFFYIAIFSTLIPFGLYFKGIERVRATRAGVTATWEPVVAGITAYFALGEVLFLPQVLGGIAVIAAVILLQMTREKTLLPTPKEIRQLR